MSINGSIIGATKIVEDYIDAFRHVGLNIDSIAASKNSINAKKLSEKYDLTYYSSSNNLIKNFNGKFIVIAYKHETLMSLLSNSLKLNTKILIEKPVTHYSELLIPYKNIKNVQVGFNRRFYSNVDYFKKRVEKNKFYVGEVSIPEIIDPAKFSRRSHKKIILNNSIHLIDLAHYFFGDLYLKDVEYIFSKKNKISSFTFKLYNSKCNILFKSIANQTKNTQFELFEGDRTFNFLPLENLQVLKDFEMKNFAGTTKYIPKVTHTIDEYKDTYKPGFVKQAMKFKELILDKNPNIPNLNDAFNSIKLIEEIDEQLKLK
jgi:predicted dehydrogenase